MLSFVIIYTTALFYFLYTYKGAVLEKSLKSFEAEKLLRFICCVISQRCDNVVPLL